MALHHLICVLCPALPHDPLYNPVPHMEALLAGWCVSTRLPAFNSCDLGQILHLNMFMCLPEARSTSLAFRTPLSQLRNTS
jgi:hypothetical protein